MKRTALIAIIAVLALGATARAERRETMTDTQRRAFTTLPSEGDSTKGARPNIILCMADDLGWGDTGYNGHDRIKTPSLDEMSRAGLRFNRWYSAAPVCSPTRGSSITGRHPYRYGIQFACDGHLRKGEITLAQVAKELGYATGHFGKWHLGTLTRGDKETSRWGGWAGKGALINYAPPWERGFDEAFSTETKVPTYNPMVTPTGWKKGKAGDHFGTYYWIGEETVATDNLEGDDSRVIMDRAIPFIQKAVADDKPFFAVVWFHAPHLPVVAGPEHRALYRDLPEFAQHYMGCVTAMDEQVGRLRSELRKLGVADNTLLCFSSDNGPEGGKESLEKAPGKSGGLRGRKRSLYEGGVRVPGVIEWPGVIKAGRSTDMPAVTSDYFPTILDVLGFQLQCEPRPYDGVSLLPLLKKEGGLAERPRPIGFESKGTVTLNDNRYKIVTKGNASFDKIELYDLLADRAEKNNIAAEHPEIVKTMKATLDEWRASCKASDAGEDYEK